MGESKNSDSEFEESNGKYHAEDVGFVFNNAHPKPLTAKYGLLFFLILVAACIFFLVVFNLLSLTHGFFTGLAFLLAIFGVQLFVESGAMTVVIKGGYVTIYEDKSQSNQRLSLQYSAFDKLIVEGVRLEETADLSYAYLRLKAKNHSIGTRDVRLIFDRPTAELPKGDLDQMKAVAAEMGLAIEVKIH